MKYCRYCGSQLADEAVICVNCGRMINEPPAPPPVQQRSSINIICLLGFIFSFIGTVVGLILSIIGYNQVKNTPDEASKNFAKAGIIISSVMIGLSVIAAVFLCWFWISFIFGVVYH